MYTFISFILFFPMSHGFLIILIFFFNLQKLVNRTQELVSKSQVVLA